MLEEQTTESIETDNSEIIEETETVEETDNSETDDTQEPEQKEEVEEEQQQGQFKSLEDATKSYQELQKLNGRQATELGELRKIKEAYDKQQAEINAQKLQEAQNKGFETVVAYENNQELTKFQVNEYSKHLNEVDYPDEMKNLLAQYLVNPSAELLDTIEAEFPISVVKDIAGKSELYKGQLQQKESEALAVQLEESARNYLNANVNKYQEDFKNPAFQELYGEAFKALGCDLDSEKFVRLVRNFADSVIKANGIKTGIENENKSATDEIAGLSVGNAQSSNGEKLLTDMSPDELKQYLRKNL